MTYMYINNFASDISIIARQKLTGFGEHWGVLLPNGIVAHSTDNKGPHYVTLQEFKAGKNIRMVRQVPPSEHNLTAWRIQQAISNPNGYHLIKNNCEIFANRVTGHPPESPQIKGWGFVFAIIGFAVLATKAA